MSGSIAIYVKKETLSSSLSIGASDKDKPYILASIDGQQPVNLVVRDEPYIFKVIPGRHEVYFRDGNPKFNLIGKIWDAQDVRSGINMGLAIIGLGAGISLGEALDLAHTEKPKKKDVKGGYAEVFVYNGEEIKVSCQKAGSGKINVKVF